MKKQTKKKIKVKQTITKDKKHCKTCECFVKKIDAQSILDSIDAVVKEMKK